MGVLLEGSDTGHLLTVASYEIDGPCWNEKMRALASRARSANANKYALHVQWHRGPGPMTAMVEGQAVVIPPGTYHVGNPRDTGVSREPAPSEGYHGVDFYFNQSLLRPVRDALGIPRWAGAFDFTPAPRAIDGPMQAVVEQVAAWATQPLEDDTVAFPLLLYGGALELLAVLWADHPSDLRERLHHLHYRPRLDARLERALAYLFRHAKSPCSVEAMAREAGCSPATAVRLFHHAFQNSPKQFLSHYRLEEAERLLTAPGMTVAAAARAVGLGSAWALRKAYRTLRQTNPPW